MAGRIDQNEFRKFSKMMLYEIPSEKDSSAENVIFYLKMLGLYGPSLLYRGVKHSFGEGADSKEKTGHLITLSKNEAFTASDPTQIYVNEDLGLEDRADYISAFNEKRFREHFHKHCFDFAIVYHEMFFEMKGMDLWKFSDPYDKFLPVVTFFGLRYDAFTPEKDAWKIITAEKRAFKDSKNGH